MTILTIAEAIAKKNRECPEIIEAISFYYLKDSPKEASEVTQYLLKSKVATQRYLATKIPAVLCHMNECDLKSLFYENGGLLTDDECLEFERAPYYDQKVRLFHIIQEVEKSYY